MARFSNLGRKGAYHSDFVISAENDGPVPIILTGKVLTKNVKHGLGTIYFKEPGETGEHYYTMDNAYMLELFQGMPQNTVLHVTMVGHKDDPDSQAAIISVNGEQIASKNWPDDAEVPAAPTQPPQAQQSAPPRQQQQARSGPAVPQQTNQQQVTQSQMQSSLTDYRNVSIQGQWAEAFKAAHDIINYALIHPEGVKQFPLLAPMAKNLTADALFTKMCEIATGLSITQNTQAGLRPMRAPREDNNGQR